MKTSAFLLPALSNISHAHTIAQHVSVNGNDNGQLVGIRSPSLDNPISAVINVQYLSIRISTFNNCRPVPITYYRPSGVVDSGNYES